MISLKKYTEQDKELWNRFNRESKNSLFMFERDYMDYHKERFIDHSLMFYNDESLIAILPMSENGLELTSHGGLTYGGFITDSKMKQHTMNDCFEALISYMEKSGFNKIRYKTIPYIYHSQPAEEDRYALFANGANLVTVDASTYVNLREPLKMPKGRKAQISRARREGVVIEVMEKLEDYRTFINLENEVLSQRHDTYAVHTAEELKMLHDRFPENIHLFAALKDERIIAGAVVFEYGQVVHTQYMAAGDEARRIGALDLAINTVIDNYKGSKLWLDFGISTEHGKIYLNEGLISQKEGFGGRTGIYEIWEIAL